MSILYMRQMNLAAVDLNLLPALEALLRRQNVTRAAEDLGLSQPAMSRAPQAAEASTKLVMIFGQASRQSLPI